MASKLILKELCRYQIGTYADIIYRNALLHGEREAFICGKERITFTEFNARVNSLIHALQAMKVKKGEVIGILSWNCLEYADVYGAVMKGGFIASPFNPRLQSNELEYIINYSEANTLFVGPELVATVNSLRPGLTKVKNFISFEGPAPDMLCHRDLLANYLIDEPDIQVEENDPLTIIYTSGTTGLSRGALYTHSLLMDNTRSLVSAMGLQSGDKHIQITPIFHIGGYNHFRVFLFIGGSNVIMPQRAFDAAATLQAIQDEQATDIDIVATHLVAMLAVPSLEKYNLKSLKRMWYAASPMPVEVLKKGIKTWGYIFAQGYGQTETGPDISDLTREDHKVVEAPPEEQGILASAGRPSIGVHVRIVDEKNNDVEPGEIGEIMVQSQHIMLEYWHKPEETDEVIINGWLHTRDMGYYDERGYIYIADRKQDMIVSGGENVYPREVEEVLYQHPLVSEAAVIGVPDAYWVEKVHAVVELKKGASLTCEELIDFCKQHIARYKAPKSVEFVDSLPKNPAGKILKTELRKKYQDDQDKQG
ncbi:long-chain-fatty-acid--CoA ligase [Chloroflexota bacterium]